MHYRLLYTLYRRPRNAGKGSRWECISDVGLKKERAIRWFQNQLIANALGELDVEFEYRLRPAVNEKVIGN